MPEIHLSRTLLLHGTRPAAGHFLSGYITCMKFHVDVPKLLLPVDVCLIHFRQSRSTAITVGFHISQRLRNDLLPLFFCGILNQISCHFLFLACLSFTANVSQQSAGCKFFSAFRVIENLRPKNSLIDLQILILKHIKDHILTLLSGVSSKYSCTVYTAICAALSFGKQNTPVDIQQNATLSSPYADASSRQDK